MGAMRKLLWGLAFVAAGATVALGGIPGSQAWATGPRIGVATLLIVLGLLSFGFALGPWIARRTARPENQGICPVGATCECGQFNFKPKRSCKACGKATLYAAA